MIGVNDVDNETFTLSDAAQVRSFAEEKERRVGVDVGERSATEPVRSAGKAKANVAQTDCSGVKQECGRVRGGVLRLSGYVLQRAVHQPPRADRRDARAGLVEDGEVGAAGGDDRRSAAYCGSTATSLRSAAARSSGRVGVLLQDRHRPRLQHGVHRSRGEGASGSGPSWTRRGPEHAGPLPYPGAREPFRAAPSSGPTAATRSPFDGDGAVLDRAAPASQASRTSSAA